MSKVYNLTYDQLNSIHKEAYNPMTEKYYFRDDGTGNVHVQALGGDYVFGVDEFTKFHPEIDMSGIPKIEFVPQELE